MKGVIFCITDEVRRHSFSSKDEDSSGRRRLQVGDERLQVVQAVVMSALDQDDSSLGHAGEGVTGIDDL